MYAQGLNESSFAELGNPTSLKVGLLNVSRTSMYDKYSGSMKITTHLDRISHCETASGANWSNRWTYRVFLRGAHRD